MENLPPDVLFPYIRRELASYLLKTWHTTETREDIQALRKLVEEKPELPPIPKEDAASEQEIREAVIQNVIAQMDKDMKTTALKALQGHMWIEGYKSGELKGHLYDDVVPVLERLQKLGVPMYIYSSGSIQAQKLLFGNSVAGDLLHFFKGHFDTTIGLKVEEPSYVQIAKQIGLDPAHILFVTDNILEAYPAQKAGWLVALADRPGNKPLPNDHPFPVVTSLDALWKEKKAFLMPRKVHRVPRVGVAVCIVKGGLVLIGKRKGSHGAGQYAFPGGQLDYGEHWMACAEREIKEETGLELKDITFSTLINDVAYGLHYVTILLQAKLKDESQEPKVMEPDKCEGWIWTRWEDVPMPWFSGLRVLREDGWRPKLD